MKGLFVLLMVALGGCGSSYTLGANAEQVEVDHFQHVWTYRLYHDPPRKDFKGARAVAFYLTGSLGGPEAEEGVTHSMGALAGFVMMNIPVVMIDRRGVEPDCHEDTCKAFNRALARRYSDKPTRVFDARNAISHYLPLIPEGTPIILIGASEGADVATKVATLEPRVTHLVLLSVGGGMTQADELGILVSRDRTTPIAPGCAPSKGFGDLDKPGLEAAFARIKADPDSDELWLGQPLKRWSSFLWSPAGDDLRRISIQTFIAQGTCDDAVPVESTRAMVTHLGGNNGTKIRYREYPGLDHSFRDAAGKNALPLVELDLVDWLANDRILKVGEAKDFKASVRDAHPELFEQ